MKIIKKLNELYSKEVLVGIFLIGILFGYSFKYDLFKLSVRDSVVSFYFTHVLKMDIPKINLEMDFVELSRIHYNHSQLLSFVKHSDGNVSRYSRDENYASADLIVGQQRFKSEIRLKGDKRDHYVTPRVSFKVKLKDGAYHGMTKFALQYYLRRGGFVEWVFDSLVGQAGNLHLRYDFVHCYLNGDYLGLYVIEENFDKRLVENNERREGPVFKFDESLLWDVELLKIFDSAGLETPYGSAFSRNFPKHMTGMSRFYLQAYKLKSIFESSSQTDYFNRGNQLMAHFLTGDLAADRVFDFDETANYLVLSSLMGAVHGITITNNRFYYDPVSGKLSPIAFDNQPGLSSETSSTNYPLGIKNELFQQLFLDKTFYLFYFDKLYRFISENKVYDYIDRVENESLIRFYSHKLSLFGSKIVSTYPHLFPDAVKRMFFDSFYEHNLTSYKRFLGIDNLFEVHFENQTSLGQPVRLENTSLIPFTILDVVVDHEDSGFHKVYTDVNENVRMPKQFEEPDFRFFIPLFSSGTVKITIRLIDMLTREERVFYRELQI